MGIQLPLKSGTDPLPHFSVHVCCGQTAGWIKMPLGTKVDLSPGHVVLDGTQPASPESGTAAPPSFWPMSIVAKRSPISATAELLLYFACDVDNAKCIVVMHVCVSVAVCPHCCTDPDVTWGVVGDAPYLCTIGRICNRRMGCVAMAT